VVTLWFAKDEEEGEKVDGVVSVKDGMVRGLS
jgi:hypothetical protein